MGGKLREAVWKKRGNPRGYGPKGGKGLKGKKKFILVLIIGNSKKVRETEEGAEWGELRRKPLGFEGEQGTNGNQKKGEPFFNKHIPCLKKQRGGGGGAGKGRKREGGIGVLFRGGEKGEELSCKSCSL